MDRQFRKRLIALAFSICFILISIYSTVFILSQMNHNCIGDGCLVCVQIHSVQDLMKQLGLVMVATLSVFANLFIAMVLVKSVSCLINPVTPILLKVRMNH